MKKVVKKILSVALVLVMLLTAMPLVFAEGEIYEVGDIIQFGSYPQTKVKDETLIAELNALAPEWDEWTSYEYYSGTYDYGSMLQGDWMRYIDITLYGEKYRGVKFTQYRPYITCRPSTYSNSHQSENHYLTNTIYWFKFEPLNWRILNPNEGFIMCETIIDAQPYSNTIYYNRGGRVEWFNDATYTRYANDYETSSIRCWLNDDFYNTAFNAMEKREISVSVLNNDSFHTSLGQTGSEELDSNSTSDHVFLLSFNEIRNSDYGFSPEYADTENSVDVARQAQGSDYAKSQGLWVQTNSSYNGNSNWTLRSPDYLGDSSCYVYTKGIAYYGCDVYSVDGIRPALRLRDIYNYNHQHSYNSVITDSTCTAQGYTTYTCECGDSYISDYINAKGHNDANGDYKCDYNCGYEFEKPADPTPSDPTEDCSCNCHAGGIKAFFFKILNFFQKLFGKNKVCACGVKH